MMIDMILDRRDGKEYNARDFYKKTMEHYQVFPEIMEPIATALDSGDDEDVKRELCRYIDEQEYNPDIKLWIRFVKWL